MKLLPRLPCLLRRALLVSAVLVAALASWVAFDLLRPHSTDIRRFDPDEVARLDTEMWRSYYSRERLKLFRQLGGLLRRQYGFSFWRSQRVAFSRTGSRDAVEAPKARNVTAWGCAPSRHMTPLRGFTQRRLGFKLAASS